MTTSKKIASVIGALIVGLVVGYVYFHRAPTPTPSKPVSGGDPVEYIPVTFVNGLFAGDVYSTEKNLALNRGSNQVSWKNTLGRTVYVTSAYARPVSTTTSALDIVASTTLKFSIGTSTAATVADSASAPVFGSLIDTYSIATSAVMTNLVINSMKDAGTNGRYVIAIQPNQYLLATLWSTAFGAGSSYPVATSSDRGYNLLVSFRYSY